MKTEEIRDLSVHEMLARIEELRIELFNLRFQKARNMLDQIGRASCRERV